MSVLRKEEPLTTADIAGQQRTGARLDDAVIDGTNADVTSANPADRRPPRSVAAGDATAYDDDARVTAADTDDAYDGEVVSSTIESSPQSVTSSRQPNQKSTFPPPRESGFEHPASQTSRESRAATSSATQAPAGRDESSSVAPLFPEAELRDFRARWDQVQTSFVDEPRHAVEQADTLVATVVKRIAEQFAEERAKLEQQWDRGDDVSTEELRQGLKRYRAFFDRLLTL